MKNIDKTKMIVLGVGCIAILASVVGALKTMSMAEFLFPIYTGLVLIGTVLLNNKEKGVEA